MALMEAFPPSPVTENEHEKVLFSVLAPDDFDSIAATLDDLDLGLAQEIATELKQRYIKAGSPKITHDLKDQTQSWIGLASSMLSLVSAARYLHYLREHSTKRISDQPPIGKSYEQSLSASLPLEQRLGIQDNDAANLVMMVDARIKPSSQLADDAKLVVIARKKRDGSRERDIAYLEALTSFELAYVKNLLYPAITAHASWQEPE